MKRWITVLILVLFLVPLVAQAQAEAVEAAPLIINDAGEAYLTDKADKEHYEILRDRPLQRRLSFATAMITPDKKTGELPEFVYQFFDDGTFWRYSANNQHELDAIYLIFVYAPDEQSYVGSLETEVLDKEPVGFLLNCIDRDKPYGFGAFTAGVGRMSVYRVYDKDQNLKMEVEIDGEKILEEVGLWTSYVIPTKNLLTGETIELEAQLWDVVYPPLNNKSLEEMNIEGESK